MHGFNGLYAKQWPFHFRINSGPSIRYPHVGSVTSVEGVPVGEILVTCHGGDESSKHWGPAKEVKISDPEAGKVYHLELTVAHGALALVLHHAPQPGVSLKTDGDSGEEGPQEILNYADLILKKGPPEGPVATVMLVRNSDWYVNAAHFVTINHSRTIHVHQWIPGR